MKAKRIQRIPPSRKVEFTLARMGLNEKEIATYLAMLSLGPSPVRSIAQKTGVNRGTTYEVLRGLIRFGLVSYFHKTRHQYFVAEDPVKLEALVGLRQNELDQTKRLVSDIVPMLSARPAPTASIPRVRFFEGPAGIRTILEDVLETMQRQKSKEYYVYSSADVREYLYASFHDFSKKRVKLDIRVKTISIGPGGKLWGLDERRWLPGEERSPTYQIIYNGKIAMISVDKEERPVGVILEDPHIATTQRIIFERLWSTLAPT
ncbi:MAG: helix-turn-helix domain-containing protein [Candidatus Kerfeldbacteria bacterium]